MLALDLQQLRYAYPNEAGLALDGVSLQVERGSFFGLLGPNGAGKTTLISILSGLRSPSSGSVEILGRRLPDREVKPRIGFCPQSLALFESLTAAENLRYFGSFVPTLRGHLAARTTEVLQLVGLAEQSSRRVDTFSGGMKRRLNLAVAVLGAPNILLLDEPTVGVDPQSRNLIFDCLEDLNENGTTVIYTTHYMEEAERLCSRLAIIDHGKVLVCDECSALTGEDGPRSFTVEVTGAADEALMSDLRDRGLQPRLLSDSALEVYGEQAEQVAAAVFTAGAQLGLEVTRFESHRRTLEHVFLELTGRQLRD